MGIRYRKRVKVAPGVYLNLSKTGVSTTIKAVKGVSVNIGKNGTYLNTGIPGTGLYSRNKISSSNKTTTGDGGSAVVFLGCGFVTCIAVCGAVAAIRGLADNPVWWIIGAIVCVFLIICLVITEFSERKDVSRKKKAEPFVWDTEIEKVSSVIADTKDVTGLMIEILKSYKDCLLLGKQIEGEEKVLKFLKKKHKAKYNSLITEKEKNIQDLHEQLEKTRFDACKEMSDVSIRSYEKMCNKFDQMMTACSVLLCNDKKNMDVEFSHGVFDFIKCPVDVPVISITQLEESIYLYPLFTLVAKSNTQFVLYPIEKQSIDYMEISMGWMNSNDVPSDCTSVWRSYTYTKRDGTRDLRYSDNPIISCPHYGAIKWSFLDGKILVSNNQSSREFVRMYSSFANLIKESTNKETSETEKKESYTELSPIPCAQQIVGLIKQILPSNVVMDDMILDALSIVVSSQFVSTSLLQRKLAIGYNRAGRLMDQLEYIGIIGPHNGSKERCVLVQDVEKIESVLKSRCSQCRGNQ